MGLMRALLGREASSQALLQKPMQAPAPQLHGAEIACVYYGQRIAGDFYDFVRVSPDRVLFGLLDVAGRVEDTRAMICAVQQTFRTRAVELFAVEDVNEADAMVNLCLDLNRTILQFGSGIHACPAFAGCYNESLGTVCYFNAGHAPGLLRDSTGITELPATGLPLGLFSHATCDAPMAALVPGGSLLVVSRGVLEAKCKGEELGLERIKVSLQHAPANNAKALSSSVLDHVQTFMCKPPMHDDVTALALIRTRQTTPAGQA